MIGFESELLTEECKNAVVIYMMELSKPGGKKTLFPIRCRVECVESFYGRRAEEFKNTVENIVARYILEKRDGLCCKCNKCSKIPVCWSNRYCCTCSTDIGVVYVERMLPQFLEEHDHSSENKENMLKGGIDYCEHPILMSFEETYAQVIGDILKRNPCFCNDCERCEEKAKC